MTTVKIVDAKQFINKIDEKNMGEVNEKALNTHIRKLEQELGRLLSVSPVIDIGGFYHAYPNINHFYLVFRK